MTPRRSPAVLTLGLLASIGLLAGCAPRLGGAAVVDDPSDSAGESGVYRGRVIDAEAGRSRRFRLLLFAELPDRVHGEVVSPVGRTELILDGGGGLLSVAVMRERIAFTGPASTGALEELVGVPVSLEGFVRALLSGEGDGEGFLQEREGPVPGLPERFEIGTDGRSLVLELRRRDALAAVPSGLGTGRPPEGFESRALAELRWSWFEEPEDPADPGY